MRLIDADALEKKLQEQRELYAEVGMKGAEHLMVHDFLRHVWEAPTIDPVRRGKWVSDEADKWRCSVCGIGNNYAYKWSVRGNELQDKYCPNCGARMVGGEREVEE